MGRIVISVLSLVALAVIVFMNAGTQVDFNLFGWNLEALPVIVIAVGSFVIGILYSFLFYLASFLAKGRRDRLSARRQKIKSKEQDIKTRDADLKQREKLVDSRETSPQPETATPASGNSGRRTLGQLFGGRKSTSASQETPEG